MESIQVHALVASVRSGSVSDHLRLFACHMVSRCLHSYHTMADRNWTLPSFVARPLASKWSGKLQPHLAINSSRLFVAAASHIYSYTFGRSEESGAAPNIQFECAYMINKVLQASRDITSIQCVPDGGFDRTVYVGYADGSLERVVLPACKAGVQGLIHPETSKRDKRPYHGSDAVESSTTVRRTGRARQAARAAAENGFPRTRLRLRLPARAPFRGPCGSPMAHSSCRFERDDSMVVRSAG